MIFFVWLLVFAIDRLVKSYIIENFFPGQSVPVIENVFHLTYVKNTGVAFGLFRNLGDIFIYSTVILVIAIIVFYLIYNFSSYWYQLAIGLILAGAVGNLIDRLIYGFVIDYLDFRIWPVFNIADMVVVIGVFILSIFIWYSEEIEGREGSNGSPEV